MHSLHSMQQRSTLAACPLSSTPAIAHCSIRPASRAKQFISHWTLHQPDEGSSTALAAKRSSTAQPSSEEPPEVQDRSTTPPPATRGVSKPRGRPRKSVAPTEALSETPEAQAHPQHAQAQALQQEEPTAAQGRGATPAPASRGASKPRGRPRKSAAPAEAPTETHEVQVAARAPTTGSASPHHIVRVPESAPAPPTDSQEAGVPPIPQPSLEPVSEAMPFASEPVKPRRGRRAGSKLKDEAELEIDLTGSGESSMRPAAPSPPQASYVQPEAPDADALHSSRQQGSQPSPGSLVSEEALDGALAWQKEQQLEFQTPGLDQSAADLAAMLASQSHGGAELTAPARRGLGRPPSASPLQQLQARESQELSAGGPLTDPGYSERVGGLADMGWEKTALREALGGIDVYRRMRTDINEDAKLPGSYMLPDNATAKEHAFMEFSLVKDYWNKRNMEREEVHQAAYAAHDASRARVSNIYANTRRVAGLMTAFEDDDYKLQEASPANIAPWARAELVFSQEFEEFNDYILQNADRLVKDMPKEAEEEELDVVDEALFLLRTEDDDRAAAKTSQQQADQALMEKYLEGVLPGATLDSLATTYANEIYESDDFDVDVNDDKGGAAGADDADDL